MTSGKLGASALAALLVAHCAGMLDLVALPVWVGALVERFGFSPRNAGMLATLFLLGAVVASLLVAPRFHRLRPGVLSPVAFALSALAFALAATRSDLGSLAALHLLAGLCTGTALSAVHGTMGRTARPHRVFALAGVAIGALGVVMLGVLPQIMIVAGGHALFVAFALAMAAAAAATALAFPKPETLLAAQSHSLSGVGRGVWLIILGISTMTLNQAMVFSFVEVIGKMRGYPTGQVLGVLIALGLVNFALAAPLAVVLEHRIRAETVVRLGPAVQAVFALVVTGSGVFPLWAPVAASFVAVQIFTHTFAFGLLARIEPTGRAVAATPAMLMSGAALGPILGGALAEAFGYQALGYVAVVIALISVVLFSLGCADGRGRPVAA